MAAAASDPSLPSPAEAARHPASETHASRRQLVLLAAYAAVIWSVGNGLLPLLPKYATTLGASDESIGYYLAGSYAAIALGSLCAGWLARLGRIKVQMVLMALVGTPIFLLTAGITTFVQLVVLTATIWWFGGVSLSLASIAAGLSAGPAERGMVLGVMALMAPLGSILGGLSIGYLADTLGFSRTWIVLGLLWLVCPAMGLFVRDVSPGPRAAHRRTPGGRLWTTAFGILLASAVLGAFGSFIGGFGRSLVMRSGFTSEELTSTVAISGLATLPFPILLGYLSDRFGRLRFLGLCYLLGVAGLLVYSTAQALAAFWLASALVAFVSYVSTGVGSALVADLVDRSSLSRGMAIFSATGWVGGILGFAAGGYLFATIGYASGFRTGAALLAAALLLLVPIAALARARPAPSP